MAFHLSRLRTRAVLSALILNLHTTLVSALTQTYCSSQNTGSGFANVDVTIFQSNGRCHDLCLANYAYAVVQADKCWCANYTPSSQQSISKCDDPCPGFPDESCGSTSAGLFGYIALDIKPSGTAGASASSVSKSASSTLTVLPPSSVVTSSVSTSFSSPSTSFSIHAAVISTTSAGRTSSSPSPSSRTKSVVTPVVIEETVTEDQTLFTSFSSSSPTATSTTPATSAKSAITSPSTTSRPTTSGMTPVTSLQVVTLSGSIITQTVTSTPVPSSGAMLGKEKSQSIAPGFIAAAVIASIAGIVLLCLALFWCYRRRRIAQADEKYAERMRNPQSPELDRNISVHSKAGLLDSAFPPQLITRFSSHNLGLSSDATSPGSTGERRNSRHLVDQRLNPSLLMVHDNGSRNSIRTLEDHRDYGRILKVANPDLEDRKSFS